jgi:SRSO17 transposase
MWEAGAETIDLTAAAPAGERLTGADLEEVVQELAAYHARFAPLFRRREQREGAALYLRGLLTADVPRKNVEAMVLRLVGAGPAAGRRVRALQYFIGEATWDDEALLAEHQRWVDETLGEDDGVLLIDGSDVPKQGTHSVGVARQWCGATGKKDNCQAGVYLGYASRRGYTLLDRRLYLPALWFTPEYRDRWQACAIPDDTVFQTKHDLAAELVAGVQRAVRVRARWVVCDEGFGDAPALLDRWAAAGLRYLAEVPRTTEVWPLVDFPGQTPRARPAVWVRPQTASRKGPAPTKPRVRPDSPPKGPLTEWLAQVPAAHWQRYRISEGAKGPLVADFVAFRAVAVRGRLPGPEVWVLIRRQPGDPTRPLEASDKFYLSNAPADTPLADLIRLSGMRWPIEACFGEGKSELGLDHYELRFWRGWHHHLTLVILAHHFLAQLQQRLSPREGGPSAGNRGTARRAGTQPSRRPRAGRSGDHLAAAGHAPAEPRRGPPAAAGAPAAAGLRRVRRVGPARLPAPTQARRLSVAPATHLAPP